jgi:ABC-type protease/lipase transport system fused ATPase/permease subunit
VLIEQLVFAGSHPEDPIGEALDENRFLFAAAVLFGVINSILALTIYMLQVYDRVLASRS